MQVFNVVVCVAASIHALCPNQKIRQGAAKTSLTDRNGGPLVLKNIRGRFPFLTHIFADVGYAGEKFAGALAETGNW